MKRIAEILSFILHPIFLPLLGFLLIYQWGGYAFYLPTNVWWFSILVWAQFTIIIPLSVLVILHWQKKISSFFLDRREERPLPLFISLISYMVMLVLFYKLNYPAIFLWYALVLTITILITSIVSLFYKISLHATAWGIFSGVLVVYALKFHLDLHIWISIGIGFSALAISARLYLEKHSELQVYSAWILALILVLNLSVFL